MNLIQLDIDGTLVDSMPLETELYPKAVCETLGIKEIKTDWSAYTNPTDSGILREVMREELSQLCHPEHVEKCKESFLRLLGSHVANNPRALSPIPGAIEFVEYLASHKQYKFAVNTGAWRESAELKLTAAGFDFSDWILYTCSEHEYKKEAMKASHMAARQEYGGDFDNILYIGDSRSDLRFANELDYEFLGRGEEYMSTNIWGVEGIKDFIDIRLVEGRINRALQAT